MRYSQIFGKTLSENSFSLRHTGYMNLLRGGYIRPVSQGFYTYLPLGLRVLQKIRQVIREEWRDLSGQEMSLPFVTPYSFWQRSGRGEVFHREMIRFKDRFGHDLVLSPRHEEAMSELLRSSQVGFEDLPMFLYQFQMQFRDERKTSDGFFRTKEIPMAESFSIHRSLTDLNTFFPRVYDSFYRIFSRCGIETIAAEASVANMGGDRAFEYFFTNGHGKNALVSCPSCGYAADRESATAIKNTKSENLRPLERVENLQGRNSKRICSQLGVGLDHFIRVYVYRALSGSVMVLVRGDYEPSKEKLSMFLKEPIIRTVSDIELEIAGLAPGYLSPLGADPRMRVVIDDTVVNSSNLALGGNEEGVFFKNANFGRDFESPLIGDVARIKGADLCRQCGAPLEEVPAQKVGSLYKIGEFYSRSLDISYYDRRSKVRYPSMGSYSIGLGRLMTAAAEANEEGRWSWCREIAPYMAFLVCADPSPGVRKYCESLEAQFPERILYDDRPKALGQKLRSAGDLGLPYQLIVNRSGAEQRRIRVVRTISGEILDLEDARLEEMLTLGFRSFRERCG